MTLKASTLAKTICAGAARCAISVATAALAIVPLGAPGADAPNCSRINFIREAPAYGPLFDSIEEVYIKTDQATPAQLRGTLFAGDWGYLNLCADEVEISTVLFSPSMRSTPQARIADNEPAILDLRGRKDIYFLVGRHWGDTAPDEGKRLIEELERVWPKDSWWQPTAETRKKWWLARGDFDADRYGVLWPGSESLRPDNADRLRDCEIVRDPSTHRLISIRCGH